ncbi:MAG: amino acid adenylation domain protein [Actinomycetia bacterium]|nr:amino acid adenylation domain protein [Actinomycetes bacterium]
MTAIEGYRLSPQQRRIWKLQGAESEAYAAWCVIRAQEPVTENLLREALAKTVGRHEVLRTTFQIPAGADTPLQVVSDTDTPFTLEVQSLLSSGYAALCEAIRKRPFNLQSGPSLSAVLVHVSNTPYDDRIILRLPALCADAISLRVLAAELIAHLHGNEPTDEPLQYPDFAQWQDELLSADEFQLERDYWLSRQPSRPSEPELPFIAQATRAFEPAVLRLDLDSDVQDGMHALAEELSVDPASISLACWQLYLRRLAPSADLLVGVHHGNRTAEELGEALGAYEKYLPYTGSKADTTFAAFAQHVHAELESMADVQEYFGWEQWEARLSKPFLVAGFDWRAVEPGRGGMWIDEAESVTDRFQIRLSGLQEARSIRLALWYDRGSCQSRDMTALAGQYQSLLRAVIAERRATVASIPLDAGQEPPRTALTPPSGLPVHRRFEERARCFPHRTAVRSPGQALTYAELNERANQLAHHLRAMGAAADQPVGLCLDRSPELLVGLLAILKAGAAYLPLDPSVPLNRRLLILNEAQVRLVVTTTEHAGLATSGMDPVYLDADRAEIGIRDRDDLTGAAGDRLAYVIFTSGSTGTPKGVGVTHANLAGYLDGILDRLGLPGDASYAMVSTVAADLGNTSVFAALCTGGTLHMLPAEVSTDPEPLRAYLRRHPVDCLKIVPSHLRALLEAPRPEELLPAQCLVLGGEAADWELVAAVRALSPSCRVLNHYGPTETTVGVLSYEVTPGSPRQADTVPLGHPLAHATAHVLDGEMRRAPVWIEGELHIGGATVARGYLGRPGLTAERFVPDPFSAEPGARIYRTGDRARTLADGSVVFLGRADHQVKVRGFRVEPGEIEKLIRKHPAVRDAVVVAREDGGAVRLAAYVVAEPGTALREHCAQHLPEYMVPATITTLDAIPLTANGKVDRLALPAPGVDRLAFTPPRSPVEQTLADIWSQVLGLERVGRDDDFFALGGDSILSIQVVARAAQAELTLTPKLMFQHPVLADLAAAAISTPVTRVEAEQGTVTGPVPPLPVQRWFLDQEQPAPHHYNQEILVRAHQPLDLEPLKAALAAIVAHHDALRLRARRTGDGGWMLDNADVTAPQPITVADRAAFEELAAKTQASLDLESGCLLHALYARLGANGDRLLLVAHHLGVDGVSWRILLEDLATAYGQAAAGKRISLPPKTTSFQFWARRLAEDAGRFAAELPYWTKLLGSARDGALPHDEAGLAANTFGNTQEVTVALSTETTGELLRSSGRAPTQAIMLAALGRALADWTGRRRVLVDVEGHGREQLWDDVDLSRTVGWFTTIYPVALETEEGPHATLRHVKEHLASVHDNGLGYGILRRSELSGSPTPATRFNYLGQVIGAGSAGTLFTSAPEGTGQSVSPLNRRPYLLDVTALVAEGQLQVTWTFCPDLHRRAAVEALAVAFVDQIHTVLAPESTGSGTGYVAEDFPLAQLDQAQLDMIASTLRRIGQDG